MQCTKQKKRTKTVGGWVTGTIVVLVNPKLTII